MPRKKHDDTTAQSYFSIGDEVEVTSIDHNLRGTLFPAKIIGKDWNADKFVVEYKHLEANDEPLREEVDLVLLRPLPPPPSEPGYRFEFGDEVDAFFSGGWWEGVITEVDDEGSLFWVYFRFAKQQFQFLPSELRVHQEWDKGAWLPPRVTVSSLFVFMLMGFLSLLLFFGFSSSACSPIGLFQYSDCVHCKCLMKKLTETCTELREIHVVFVGMEL